MVLIVGFMVGYDFYITEFLSLELRDRAFGGQKELLAYPCMIR